MSIWDDLLPISSIHGLFRRQDCSLREIGIYPGWSNLTINGWVDSI